jgi:hypothetical protein
MPSHSDLSCSLLGSSKAYWHYSLKGPEDLSFNRDTLCMSFEKHNQIAKEVIL